MIDRRFSEGDLREMLEDASALEPDVVEGRFILKTRRGRRSWEVVVEPDAKLRRLVIVTAYPVEGRSDAN